MVFGKKSIRKDAKYRVRPFLDGRTREINLIDKQFIQGV
jgi:hypothetical protein